MSGRNVAGVAKATKTIPWAREFFEELSLMVKPKPNMDIERRRKAINVRHNLRITKAEGEVVFKELERLGLGKLRVQHGPGAASTFKWASDIDYVSMAREVVTLSAPQPRTQTAAPVAGAAFVFRLSSGQILKLTGDDVHELKHVLASL